MIPHRANPTALGGHARASDKGCLPLSVADYLQLLDWTGRQVARGKRGAIPVHLEPILIRAGLQEAHWLQLVSHFGRYFHRVAGASRSVTSQHAVCALIGGTARTNQKNEAAKRMSQVLGGGL